MKEFCSFGVYDKKDAIKYNFYYIGKDQKYCSIFNDG